MIAVEEPMVSLQNVTKRFKNLTALDQVSVSFARGKIHGIIGRNGSGKTVMFKCICGFMQPTEGKIFVDGEKVVPSAAQDIGIIIEDPGFIPSLSAVKNLQLLASVRRAADKERVCSAIERVGLDPNSKQHVGKFSLGMRHRLGIAQAIMEKPKMLILDEPMNGLDKHGVEDIRGLLRELCEQEGVTILMSSHYAEDIEALCDTVCEMDCGKLTRLRGFEQDGLAAE